MTPDDKVRCPKCPRTFLASHIEQHLKEHETEEAERVAENFLNPYQSEATFFEAHPENIDATKNIGYPARDYKARYGTYPGHDGFDDESGS